jgi:hypothetical protein
MNRFKTAATVSFGLVAGYIFASTPNYAALKTPNQGNAPTSPNLQILAQSNEAQEQQLLNQIESDSAKLKADEAAERAQGKPVNPDVARMRGASYHLVDAGHELLQSTGKYSGHKADAMRAIRNAYYQVQECYRIAKSK